MDNKIKRVQIQSIKIYPLKVFQLCMITLAGDTSQNSIANKCCTLTKAHNNTQSLEGLKKVLPCDIPTLVSELRPIIVHPGELFCAYLRCSLEPAFLSCNEIFEVLQLAQ